MKTDNNENRFTFGIEGMTCASCVRIVDRSLRRMPGVKFVSINLGTEKGYVITEPDISIDDIITTINSTGYKGLREVPDEEKVMKDFKRSRRMMVESLAVMLPLTVLMILHMSGMHMPWFPPLEAAAALLVLLRPGRGVIKGASIAAMHLHANMDTLVLVSAFFAMLTSFLHISGVTISSFGSISVMLVSLHLTGRYIESRLKYNATSEVRALLNMKPREAFIVRDDSIISAAVESIAAGEIVAVRTGERVPLDSRIIEGSCTVDESMITGEPGRVLRSEGDEITGGTVVESGSVRAEVIRTGEDTFLARMTRLVEDAQSSKVPIQAMADRITGIFVPAIFIIAVLSAFTWWSNYDRFVPFLQWLSNYIPWIQAGSGPESTAVFIFIAVLVIACPCALGLATPMALIAGSGLAVRSGLLIKNGEAIQTAGSITTVFLDKTGTITLGKPSVISHSIQPEHLPVLLALENSSIHPLSSAIKEYCAGLNISQQDNVSDIKEIPGSGITGTFAEKEYFIGSPLDSGPYSSMMSRGETVMELRINGKAEGYISAADPVKPDSAEAVEKLKALGVRPVMLTGDCGETAQAVAAATGIDDVISRVRPEDKLFRVQEIQKQGGRVSMVGDGINDAAALKAADLGIALGTGTDISIESADIIITGDRLTAVPDSISISRITFTKIRQNLFRASVYNLVAIPAAIMGLMHPAVAEICMILSSTSVILNSTGIKKINPQEKNR